MDEDLNSNKSLDENAGAAPVAPVAPAAEARPDMGVKPIDIEDEMQNSYIDYSMSVIVGRALPDARDGMKPVHRRCVYTMGEMGNVHSSAYKKSARVVGEVMGKYHPHGDSSIYDTIVRLAQPFAMRYLLVDGHGNFGSVDGDGAAAMRYTEVRMQKYAEDMLEDLDKETVDMAPNYDETLEEPTVLPSKLPNLLLNGSMGIAVGMATNIPTHNLNELCDAVMAMVDDPSISVEGLMRHVKGPDFPTGGIICGLGGIRDMYMTGRGSIVVRGRATIEDTDRRSRITITDIPYNVNKAEMVVKMGELVRDKVIEGISEIRDLSKEDTCIEIDVKQDADANVVLNMLYKYTPLQSTFGANMLALDHGRPKVMNLKQLLRCFIEHRIEVITRRTKYLLRKAKERRHLLEGFRIAIDNVDEIVHIIRSSRDDAEAKQRMFDRFGLDDVQASAILEMRLRQLTGMQRDRIENEYREVCASIERYTQILADPDGVTGIVKQESAELKAKYGDDRRTEISLVEANGDIEALIPDVPCVLMLTRSGYVKRVPMAEFNEQNRGGQGVIGIRLKDGDSVMETFSCKTKDLIMFFTSYGRVFCQKAYTIPETERNTKGKPIVNILNLKGAILEDRVENGATVHARPAERVLSFESIDGFHEDVYVLFATRKGVVKRTVLSAFQNVNRNGIIAIKIDDDDELIGVTLVKKGDEALLVSANGQTVRFDIRGCRSMGRASRGVRGIRLAGQEAAVDDAEGDSGEQPGEASDPSGADELRALVKLSKDDPGANVLMLVENGYGKRTEFEEFPLHKRGGKGVKSIDTGDRNGKVVFAGTVHAAHVNEAGEEVRGDALMVTTERGKTICTGVDSISQTHRVAKGVRVVRLAASDKIVACSVLSGEFIPESRAEAADSAPEAADAHAAAPEGGASADAAPEAPTADAASDPTDAQ